MFTAEYNIDNYEIVPMALTDHCGIMIGTLVEEWGPIVCTRALDDAEFSDPCRLGYTPFSAVKKGGASEWNGYMEVIADSTWPVGPCERGSRRETTNDDGWTTRIFDSIWPV